LFHNANLFGSCVIHILYAGCAKIKKNNSGTKGLICEQQVKKCAMHKRQTTDREFREDRDRWSGEAERERTKE